MMQIKGGECEKILPWSPETKRDVEEEDGIKTLEKKSKLKNILLMWQ